MRVCYYSIKRTQSVQKISKKNCSPECFLTAFKMELYLKIRLTRALLVSTITGLSIASKNPVITHYIILYSLIILTLLEGVGNPVEEAYCILH